MHNAPPVAFPVGRFVWGRVALLTVASLGAMGLLMWQAHGHVAGMIVLWAWIFWGLCITGAAFWAPRQVLTQGRLSWSGEAWFWQPEAGSGHAECAAQGLALSVGLDLGASLLLFVRKLNVQGQGCGPWACAWLSEDAMPAMWHGFRCAVYSQLKVSSHASGLSPESV
jgi:hypothetical protein